MASTLNGCPTMQSSRPTVPSAAWVFVSPRSKSSSGNPVKNSSPPTSTVQHPTPPAKSPPRPQDSTRTAFSTKVLPALTAAPKCGTTTPTNWTEPWAPSTALERRGTRSSEASTRLVIFSRVSKAPCSRDAA
eukprot:PhF_6_TR6898/c2_g1_i1/m.10009